MLNITAAELKARARLVNNLTPMNEEAADRILQECRNGADEGLGSLTFICDGKFETKKSVPVKEWYEPIVLMELLKDQGFLTFLEDGLLMVIWDHECPSGQAERYIYW